MNLSPINEPVSSTRIPNKSLLFSSAKSGDDIDTPYKYTDLEGVKIHKCLSCLSFLVHSS